MTLQQFAQSMIDDADYRQNVMTRARAGTLPADIELLLLELADGRLPLSADRAVGEPARTLTLVRPSAPTDEVQA